MKNPSKNSTKISGIIFDWGGIFSYSGDPLSRPEIIKKLKTDRNSINNSLAMVVDAFSRGKMTSREYWHNYAKALNVPGYTPQKLKKLYLEYTPNHGMLDLLKPLSEKYPLALLSNLNIDMKQAIIKGLGIDKYFKHMIFSNDVGLLKPELAIYQMALKALDLPANKILFVDDELKNIEAAKGLGVKTVLFSSEKQCRAKLKHFKLL